MLITDKEKQKEYNRKYYAENADKISENAKKRYSEDPAFREKRLERVRVWRAKNPEKLHRWEEKNRERHLETRRKYRAKNPEKHRHYALKSNYGISSEDFDSLFISQNGKCKICHEKEACCVDHCHDTGKVRGLLCHKCNIGLGHFKDSIPLLGSAIYYLSEQ